MIYVMSLLSLLLIISNFIIAQDCPSRSANKTYANNFLQEQTSIYDDMVNELLEKYGDCISQEQKSAGDKSKSGKSNELQTKEEVDESGKTHYYVGHESSEGSINWREVDALPLQNKTGKTGTDELTEAQKAWCQQHSTDIMLAMANNGEQARIVSFAKALVSSIGQIPCGVIIKEIECSKMPGLSNCMMTWKDDAGNEYKYNGGGSLDKFYESLKQRMKDNRMLVEARKSKQTNRDNNNWKTILQNLQRENMNLRDIEGRRVDIDEDGTLDYVWKKEADGTEIKHEDTNGDGRSDNVIIKHPDESATLIIDSDLNWKYDTRVEIKDGDRKQYKIDETVNETPSVPQHGYSEAISSNPFHDFTAMSTSDILAESSKPLKALEVLSGSIDDLKNNGLPSERTINLEMANNLVDKTLLVRDGYTTAKDIYEVYKDPTNIDNRHKAADDIVNLGTKGIELTGIPVGDLPTDYDETVLGVFKGAEKRINVLYEGGEDPGHAGVVAPVLDYIGRRAGVGDIGTTALGYKEEGNLSWNELRTKYGPIQGTFKAAWYYLLDDLHKKYPQNNEEGN